MGHESRTVATSEKEGGALMERWPKAGEKHKQCGHAYISTAGVIL